MGQGTFWLLLQMFILCATTAVANKLCMKKSKVKSKGTKKLSWFSLSDASGTAGAGGCFSGVTKQCSCAYPFVNGRLCGGDPDGWRWVCWPVQFHLPKDKYAFSNFTFFTINYASLNHSTDKILFTPVFYWCVSEYYVHVNFDTGCYSCFLWCDI